MRMTADVNVVLVDLPSGKTHEMVCENADGSYTITLNARDSAERRRMAFIHAMDEHISKNDFEKMDADQIEERSHNRKP